jgi:hypothetical protein
MDVRVSNAMNVHAVSTIDASPSPAFLGETNPVRRQIVKPQLPVSTSFLAAFEDRALVYDCFFDAAGKRILLVGPPFYGLETHWRGATIRALPSRRVLKPAFIASISQLLVALDGAPEGTTAIGIEIAGETLDLPVRANLATVFAGRRVLFSMNKNNDLDWIRFWARHHARYHGTDTVVLFDNGSSRYGTGELVDALRGVEGIDMVSVPSWPWRFGAKDDRLKVDPFWSHFLQNCSMNVVLRRFAGQAHSILNCDVDELVWTGAGRSIHDMVRASVTGFYTFKGQWIEAVADRSDINDHRRFHYRLRDANARFWRDSKWVLDPTRKWVASLRVHPYWHWLDRRPLLSKQRAPNAFYWHFKGINTNWKVARAVADAPDPALHEVDPRLPAEFS